MEEREYQTALEVANEMGVTRPAVYHYIKVLGIATQRFPLSRKSYIAAADVRRIKEARDKPWTVERVTA